MMDDDGWIKLNDFIMEFGEPIISQYGIKVSIDGFDPENTYIRKIIGPDGEDRYTIAQPLSPEQQELLNLQQQGYGVKG